jgi:hypothetical protein
MLRSLSAKAGTTVRRIGAVATVLALGLLSTSPASAYWDRYHRWYGPCCAPGIGVVIGGPPVVYAPPPPPVYYAPPPVYYAPPPVVYAPPPVSFGVNIR